MMNGKLNIQNLIDLFAEKHKIDKKVAEEFVKGFFLLIEEGLEKDKYVKIRGLGTFKLIDVESRESINVNTGERFEIQGHTKISFSPDSSLKEIINRPFSHFETVPLNESTVFEDMQVGNENMEDENSDQLEPVDDVGTEQPVDADTNNERLKSAKMIEPMEGIKETGESATDSVEITGCVMEVKETEKSGASQGNTEFVEDSYGFNNQIENQKMSFEPVSDFKEADSNRLTTEMNKADGNVENVQLSEGESEVNHTFQHKKLVKQQDANLSSISIKYYVYLFLAVLFCGSVVFYLYLPDLFTNNLVEKDPVETVNDALPTDEKDIVDNIIPDKIDGTLSVTSDTAQTIQQKAKLTPITAPQSIKEHSSKVKEKKSNAPFVTDSVNYIIAGTKASYTIKEGETLTKVALRFYGTKSLWPYLVKHNPDIIKNPNNVPCGTTIKIPELVKR